MANEETTKTSAIMVVKKLHHITIHKSISISLFPTHGISLEDLVCKVDLALYVTKQQGKY